LKILRTLSVVLVVVGGLNWGLVGLLNFNLVSTLFGTGTLSNVVYDLVGLAAVYLAFAELSSQK
jgi:uncharacterized protein